MRLRHILALAVLATIVGTEPATAQFQQEINPLFQRWVGRNPNNRPIFLDFYGDSMVVVNDVFVSSFISTRDSLVVFGDTSFAVSYEFRLDRMLIHNADGSTMTMSTQPLSARPIFGGRIGQWASWYARLGNGRGISLEINRSGDRARWRPAAGGSWRQGEWDRDARTIVFTWLPDSTEWRGSYDAAGHQIIFEEIETGSGVAIFRRAYRQD